MNPPTAKDSMLSIVSLLLATAISPVHGASRNSTAPLRVACLGDSLTYGARVVDREHNSYPAQLSALLGESTEVRNFGVGGRTLLYDGDAPYAATEEIARARAWEPDLSIVILGTNDTCLDDGRKNWEHEKHLERDAQRFVNELIGDREGARVLLCTPPPMFPEASGLEESRRENLRARAPRLERIGEALRDVARGSQRVEFLDLSRVLTSNMVVDGVHTTPFGARAIAQRLAEAAITPEQPALVAELGALRPKSYHGYRTYDFALAPPEGDAFPCTIVAPESPAPGYPWIWRARFFGHEPELEMELLSRGYHVAYCDVAGLFGAELAMYRWDRFYRTITAHGLSKRVTIEGMSRGGLVALNWAARHPERVEALYLDNPVCDFRSWPGGRNGKRSDGDWTRCLEVYGLTEEQAWEFGNMPLDRLAPIAEAEVPVFLVMGEADEVVPPGENGELLARRLTQAGGSIEVWRKPGTGHHPHGLHPVAPLLRALLRVTGRGVNPATRPTPSAEYCGHPAGWGGGTWWGQLEKLKALGAAHPDTSLVFFGDSITQGLTGSADRAAREGGSRHFDRYQGARAALSLGLSGDRTEHLLYRIEHGALTETAPRVIVLMIGVNNVNSGGHTGIETGEGLAAVTRSLLEHEPQAEILICGPFPAGGSPNDPRRRALDRVHDMIAPMAHLERVTYLDLRPLFLDEAGLPNGRMAKDHIHITAEGQEAWMQALEPQLARLLRE